MCVGSRPSAPPPPTPDPSVQAAQKQQRDENQAMRSERKQETLEKGVRRARGGSGRRSLLSGSSGGMGYYNEFL
jgi:hypothetical protein